jgi:hypothetical protein
VDVLVVSEQAAARDALSAVAHDAFPRAAVHAEKTTAVRRAERVDLVLLDLAVSGGIGIDPCGGFAMSIRAAPSSCSAAAPKTAG